MGREPTIAEVQDLYDMIKSEYNHAMQKLVIFAGIDLGGAWFVRSDIAPASPAAPLSSPPHGSGNGRHASPHQSNRRESHRILWAQFWIARLIEYPCGGRKIGGTTMPPYGTSVAPLASSGSIDW